LFPIIYEVTAQLIANPRAHGDKAAIKEMVLRKT
jgi:hypothetical protein